ncbi:MAG: SPOR domain-containing protein [Bacteroidota bacterium]
MRNLISKSHYLFSILFFLSVSAVTFAQSYHYLIAGSFKTESKAQEHAQKLQRAGYNPSIIFPYAGSANFRVSIFEESVKWPVADYQKKVPAKMPTWILSLNQPAESYNLGAARRTRGNEEQFYLVYGTYASSLIADDYVSYLKSKNFRKAVKLGPYREDGRVFYLVTSYSSPSRYEVERVQSKYFKGYGTYIILR